MIPWLLQKVFGTKHERELKKIRPLAVSYTHLTLPTNREV